MLSEFRAERGVLSDICRKGECDEGILRRYSQLVDKYIVDCFQSSEAKKYEGEIALVALGGYGREELFHHSDVDIMILYRPEIKNRVGVIADAVLYPLWDAGLEVGHGVRTIDESMAHAEEDYFFLVALLDARLIHGSFELFAQLLSVYRQRFVDGHRENFVKKMQVLRQARRERFGSHSYLLEPHIKEGRGGMRDMQAMMWTAGVVFGLNNLDDIQMAGLLDEEGKQSFIEARAVILRLRGNLHSLVRRKSDQLYFEHQQDIAGIFGYRNEDGVLAVERFMREVYGALRTVSVTTDLFFDHVDEVLGFAGKTVAMADKEIEKGVEIKNGRIHLAVGKAQLLAKPQLLLRIFLAMARTGLLMHHRTRKVVAANLDLITDKVRCSPRVAKTFFALLIEAKEAFMVLETMLETGVLVAFIPEFSRVVTLAQHDLYHIYTVDRHSLQTVAELHQLIGEWEEGVVESVNDLNVLYVAALLHDIGKGSGKDHSLFGEELVGKIGHRLCFSEKECSRLQFLVRYHLFIPENALRRDLNDAVFIQRCAETIGDSDRLAMLYLLSVADSKATGPSAWSEWKASLMEEMYLKVRSRLDFAPHGVRDVVAHEEQGVEWLRERVLSLLKKEKGLKVDIGDLGADYILSFTPEVIAEHIVMQRDKYQLIRQKSLITASETGENWSLLIMAADRPGLLAKICGVMALNNLAVIKAQIFTWADGTVVDVIDVRSTDGLSFEEEDWPALNEQLNLAIEHRMGLSHRLYRKLTPLGGRRTQMVSNVASEVIIDNSSSDKYSVIEVYAADLPGHLYHITQAMTDFGMNIYKAYIATEVEQLIDAFYVLDSRGKKVFDEEYRREITQGILYSIGCKDVH